MLETVVFVVQTFWIPAAIAGAFVLGMSAGWIASSHAAARDADDGRGFIYWRAKRYRVIPDDDRDDERKNRHDHGSMAEQSWP